MIYKSFTENDTAILAGTIAEKTVPGDIICLCGSLGAGKTAFVQSYAKALGVSEYVSSPTFTLLNIYETGQFPIYHFDLYRLMDSHINTDALENIGFFEYTAGQGVSLIEWADCASDFIDNKAIWITIKIADDHRKIIVTGGKDGI